MSVNHEFPLGTCEIEFQLKGASEKIALGITLEESDTSFITSFEINKIMVDQLSGPYKAFYVPGENPAQFKCSILLDTAILPKLGGIFKSGGSGIAYIPSGEVQYGELRIHPIESGTSTDFDIVGKKVSCTPVINGTFKKTGKTLVDLTFDFAGNDDRNSDEFNVIFTIGTYKAVASRSTKK